MRKKNMIGFNAATIKKQLKNLPEQFGFWENDVNEDEFSKPTIKLPSYFLYLEELDHGMTADVWGFLSIDYHSDYGYLIYENLFTNALSSDLEKQYSKLNCSSLSRQKVLRICRESYKNKKFDLPKNYSADYNNKCVMTMN